MPVEGPVVRKVSGNRGDSRRARKSSPTAATHPSRQPLERNRPGAEIGCGGSPCLDPRCGLVLRIPGIRPPLAPGSCARRQCEAEQRLHLLECEHNDRGVAMFQVRVERPILARNVRPALLDGKGSSPRAAERARLEGAALPSMQAALPNRSFRAFESGVKPVQERTRRPRPRRRHRAALPPLIVTFHAGHGGQTPRLRIAEFVDHSIDACLAFAAVVTNDTHRRNCTPPDTGRPVPI